MSNHSFALKRLFFVILYPAIRTSGIWPCTKARYPLAEYLANLIFGSIG